MGFSHGVNTIGEVRHSLITLLFPVVKVAKSCFSPVSYYLGRGTALAVSFSNASKLVQILLQRSAGISNLKSWSPPEQWSPNFLAPGTMEDSFSTDLCCEGRWHYIYYSLYFYYYHFSTTSDHQALDPREDGHPCHKGTVICGCLP